jgi:hypothetical protein
MATNRPSPLACKRTYDFVRPTGWPTAIAKNKKPAAMSGGLAANRRRAQQRRAPGLLLPRALFVTVRLEAFPALVLRHFQPAFLFEITHGERELCAHRARRTAGCKAHFTPIHGGTKAR